MSNPFVGYKKEEVTNTPATAPNRISQAKLRSYQERCDAYNVAVKNLKKVEQTLGISKLETEIKAAIPFNAFEPGRLTAWFEDGRKAPAWKQAFEHLCMLQGLDVQKFVAYVEAATEASKSMRVGCASAIEQGA